MSDLIDRLNRQVEAINQAIATVPSKAKVGARRALSAHGKMFTRILQTHILRGDRGNTDVLHRRSGTLARALHDDVIEADGRIALIVWFDKTAQYARTHEYGQTIRPNGHPYLAIPVGPSLTPAGVAKYSSPLDVVFGDGEGLQFMQKKGGKPFLGHVENGKVVAYFLLREEVKIPARMGMREEFRKQAVLAIPRMATEIKKELAR